jgi:preprotein translocase subunit Sec63
LVKLKALFTGRKPGEPHFRSATWNLVYTVVIAILYVLIYYCATFSNDDVEYFDPFEILGVDESATANAIKKAYRKLSMSAHPDKGGDAATCPGPPGTFKRPKHALQ